MEQSKMKDQTKTVWILSGVALVAFVIILFMYKKNHPEFDMASVFKWLLIGGGGLALVSYGYLYFSKKAGFSPSKNEKLAPAITFAQARDLAKQSLADPMYMDEIDLDKIEKEAAEEVGKPASKVYVLVAFGKHTKNTKYAIGINMHYPETMKAFSVNPTDYQINRMVQKLAVFPEEEAAQRVTQVKNLSTGTEVVTTEPAAKADDKKEESKDPLDKS